LAVDSARRGRLGRGAIAQAHEILTYMGEVIGDIKARDGLVKFRKQGCVVAVASIFRDQESLRAELDLEQPT